MNALPLTTQYVTGVVSICSKLLALLTAITWDAQKVARKLVDLPKQLSKSVTDAEICNGRWGKG